MSDIYNKPIKESYLEEMGETSKEQRLAIFKHSSSTEEFFRKDLYSFNINQIEEVMKKINPQTPNSARAAMYHISSYISWATERGYREANLPPLKGLGRKWYTKFIDTQFKKYFTEEEINDIIENDVLNAQDQALIRCLFEGISGKGMSELISMKYDGIDWNKNLITVYDTADGEVRTVEVSDKCMRYIENAYKEMTYTAYSDNESEDASERDLYQDEHIFRNTVWKVSKTKNASQMVLVRRLANIRDYLGLDTFTSMTINKSGQIKMAVDLFNKTGRFDKEEIALIGDRYKLSKVKIGEGYYNRTIVEDHINRENILSLYGIDIEK
ncbi:phage lytic cycle repressor MrpR family protein [Lederbergia lenta]|uniref:phage lytic cycle repressor MrpR family protein n=1 Tax=Lederbergia lenta TaxID=1467 RepID=UPI00203DD84E|nr:hypothetical protein [Lederbergia lenta]MCM3109941.1 hypothetical protein [Lederbergia lenta]